MSLNKFPDCDATDCNQEADIWISCDKCNISHKLCHSCHNNYQVDRIDIHDLFMVKDSNELDDRYINNMEW